MKIYNQSKTEILTTVDLESGYLVDDVIVVKTIPAQSEVPEDFHYEYKEYENGGRDRIKVIDTERVPYKPEQYEYENIQIYIPYNNTEKAIKKIEKLRLWFDTEYTKQEQKYRRLRTLSKLCDDGSNPEIKLRELYILAEQKRLEIQQLEEVNDDKGIDY